MNQKEVSNPIGPDPDIIRKYQTQARLDLVLSSKVLERFRDYFWLDPAKLVPDNPAAEIVNEERYKQLEAAFSWDRFDPPQAAPVVTFGPDGQSELKLLVVDGMTRSKYAADQGFPAIPLNVVTTSILQDKSIVKKEDMHANRKALSMQEYLRAVVPPTVEHANIARPRIASHILNAFGGLAGIDDYSGTAALGFLADPKVPTSTEHMLRGYLSRQGQLVAGETEDRRNRIVEALVQIAAIIGEAKLFPKEVAEAAYDLIAQKAETIGGEKGVRTQVLGLRANAVFDAKLTRGYPGERNNFHREQERMRIFTEALKLISGPQTEEQEEKIYLLLSMW